MYERAHRFKVAIALALSTGVLVATSSAGDVMTTTRAVTLAPGDEVSGTVLMSPRATRRTDDSYMSAMLAGTTGPGSDAGPDALPLEVVFRLRDLPIAVLPGTGGLLYSSFHELCETDDCALPLTITNTGSQEVMVELTVYIEDYGNAGLICGEAGNYPEDATLELVLP